jgi:hypothetical protein
MQMFKKIFILINLLFFALLIKAQKIDVAKDGLVKADGKDAFYLEKRNVTILGMSDFLLKDLQKKDIAYLKAETVPTYNYNNRYGSTTSNTSMFTVTFMKSGNQAIINSFTSLSVPKSVARTLYNAELFAADGNLDPYKERLYCLSTGGRLLSPEYAMLPNSRIETEERYVRDPIAPKNGDILELETSTNNLILNQGEIYYKKIFKGTHSRIVQKIIDENTNEFLVNFFDTNNLPTYTAIYLSKNSDWVIIDKNQKQVAQIMYDAAHPLEDLIQNLISNNYIK